MPRENPPTRRPAESARPAVRNAASTAWPSVAGATSDLARSTTSYAVSQPSNSGTSGQTAIWPRPVSMLIVPRSARLVAASRHSSVVLPAPFGPTRPETEPRGTTRSTSNRPVPP
jgi:hypothetical protein